MLAVEPAATQQAAFSNAVNNAVRPMCFVFLLLSHRGFRTKAPGILITLLRNPDVAGCLINKSFARFIVDMLMLL